MHAIAHSFAVYLVVTIHRKGGFVARPQKTGLDYFPLDTVLDKKFELIEAEYGLTGFAIVVKLLQEIYRGDGYYGEWTEEVALLFSRKVGEGYNVVSEIVRASVRRGIFDKDMFDRFSILTSRGIQERYLEAVSRRANVSIKKEYLLISDTQITESVNNNGVNADNNGVNVCINPQIKKEEIKRNERKENQTRGNSLDSAVATFRGHIGYMNPTIKNEISAWVGKVDLSLIEYAIEEASKHGKLSWSYVCAVLSKHHSEGRTTREEAEEHSRTRGEAEFEDMIDDMLMRRAVEA